MNILGLHFGHDGGVAMVCDGVPAAVILTERISRIKHGCSLDETLIDLALRQAGIHVADIDFCTITTTQTFPFLLLKDGTLDMDFSRHPDSPVPPGFDINSEADAGKLQVPTNFAKFKTRKVMRQWESQRIPGPAIPIHSARPSDMKCYFAPEMLPRPSHVADPISFAEIRRNGVSRLHLAPRNRNVQHVSMTVTLRGRKIPAAFVDHHAAHAADSYYQSGMQSAAVFTFDGGMHPDFSSSLFLGNGPAMVPIAMPRMWAGPFYDGVGAYVGRGIDAGKLMGLAPYGKPAFFRRDFIGTGAELGFNETNKLIESWIKGAVATADQLAYDRSAFGDTSRILEAINTDMAASAHLTFEENVLAFLGVVKAILTDADLTVDGVCLAGGCALSCPTNTRVALESGFGRVFVPPSCDDTGLAVGGALWAYHNLMNKPLLLRDADYPVSPYVGAVHAGKFSGISPNLIAGFQIEELGLAAGSAAAARDVASNNIVGWYEGRSEIGPRALGHRSILADPRRKENWARVNAIKGRENWRPLAPMVLKEDASRWFNGMQLPSPYMLFTGNVTDPSALPAITHVDGTARVQTVDAACGFIHDVLREYRTATEGHSVVLNTSFNGPGEPIVETPEQALAFFAKSGLDGVYIDGTRVTRTQ